MKICYSCFRELPAGAGVCPECGCGADLKNEEKYPYSLPCGSVLNGRYIIGRVLGQGGFGITYAGQDFNSKKLVAIKEYFPDTMASREQSHSVVPLNSDRNTAFEYGKEQFLREARTLSAFIGSPNIVRVHRFFEENGTAYFVMEYVHGQNLRQYLESRGGRISWEEAWKIMMPVLEALSEIHSKKIIHRDIKPENIIMTRDGRAKLIDFGAARYHYGEKSRSLTAVLTPGYAPWEQYYTRGEQGPWTDVYALAATMYFCITGKTPPDSIERMDKDRLEKPSSLGISIPDYAEAALLKAIALKKKDRFQTTYDFRNAVLDGKRKSDEINGKKLASTPLSPENSIFNDARKLAESGDANALFLVGYFYETGMGVPKNEKEAEKWYIRAAAQGNADARMKLNRIQPGHRADKDVGQKKEENGLGKKTTASGGGTLRAEERNKPEEGAGGGSRQYAEGPKTSPETGRTDNTDRTGNESLQNDRKDEKSPDKPGESSTAGHTQQEQA